ncbi:hypothetical protein [Lutibacter sp.]
MGEKLKILSKGKLKNVTIEVELNKPDKPKGLHPIHIQNDEFRFDMDEIEFVKLATGILAAKRKLLVLKGDL